MNVVAKGVRSLFWLAAALHRRVCVLMRRPLFASHGRDFHFDPFAFYSFENISVGDHVTLGNMPIMMAARSQIRIGSNVMFGPQVVFVGGGHNTSVVGQFMTDVHVKRAEDDLGVVIEDDVWVGTRAIILHGVTVGRGAIVAAGSIVTHDVPPYAVVAGVPARIVRFRWPPETIVRHESCLYPVDERLELKRLQEMQSEMSEESVR